MRQLFQHCFDAASAQRATYYASTHAAGLSLAFVTSQLGNLGEDLDEDWNR